MPWNTSGDPDEFSITVYFEDYPNYNYSNAFQPLEGVLAVIHSPDELITQSSHHFYMRDHMRYEFSITPDIVSIADELKSWPVAERNCFLSGEKNLEFYRIYTKNNCEQECLSIAAYKTCGCLPFFMIRKFFCFRNYFERLFVSKTKFRRSIAENLWPQSATLLRRCQNSL